MYDMIVVGGGAAGLVTSAGAAGIGARVALIEENRLGGECLWNGCVPSKALIACARAAHDARHSEAFGVRAQDGVRVDFARAMEWVREAQRRIEPHDSPERFRSLGVDVITGRARFTGQRTLRVDGRELSAKRIVIATGSKPAIPPIDGLENVPYLTNETVFSLETLPEKLIVMGAGPIGLELAQAFARLGSRVRVLEAMPLLLPREDRELAEALGARLADEGCEILLGVTVLAASKNSRGIALLARRSDDTTLEVEGDALLVATGRRSNVESLELARGGVATTKDGVQVDGKLHTTADGVWAAGDVTGGLRFTHVADHEARSVVRNAFFPLPRRVDYSVVPWVTYTEPELAHLGLTEAEANEQFGGNVRVWRRSFDDVDRAITDGQPHGMVKIITTKRGRILGAHILGHGAGNMIAEVAVAMRAKLPITSLANTIHPYPTYQEAIRQAAGEYYKSKFTGPVRSIAGWFARR